MSKPALPSGVAKVSVNGHLTDTVEHRLGGCAHPAMNSRMKLRHGCTVDLIAHMVGMGWHGDILHDVEGLDCRYHHFLD